MADLRDLLKPGDNAELIAVSVDPAEKGKELVQKIARDGKGDVKYQLLSDSERKVIDAYGLYDPAYAGQKFDGIPHPAVYVLDKSRKIVWARVESDYRKRPSIEEIRAGLEMVK